MVQNIKNIIKISLAEMKNVFKDEGTLLIMFLGIFLYSFFYLIPFSTGVLKDVPIGIVDNDNSKLSRDFGRNLDAAENLKVVIKVPDISTAKEMYYQNKIKAFVVIPKDFERDIKRGGNSFISAYEDSSFVILYKQVASGISLCALEVGAKFEVVSLMKKGFSKQQAVNIVQPFQFVSIPLFNTAGSYLNYIMPIILSIILQQTMLVGVGLLGGTLREQIQGVRQRINGEVKYVKIKSVSKYSNNPYEIVLGKSFGYLIIYMFYSMYYFLIFPLFTCYGIPKNIILLFVFTLLFLLSVSFLAQSLVGLFTKREGSLFLLIVASVPFVFLPGIVWPREAIPCVVAFLSKFIPVTSAIDGYVKINQMGAGFSHVIWDIVWLVFLTFLYFVIAVNVTKKMIKETEQN